MMIRKFSLKLAVSLAVLVGLGWPLPLRAEVRVPAAVNLESLFATQAGTSTVLAVQADAPFRYQTYRASLNSLWIDLEDVDLGSVARSLTEKPCALPLENRFPALCEIKEAIR